MEARGQSTGADTGALGLTNFERFIAIVCWWQPLVALISLFFGSTPQGLKRHAKWSFITVVLVAVVAVAGTPNKRGGKMKRFVYLVATVAAMVAFAAGCGGTQNVGELRTESRSVELENARTAQVNLDMGIGELKVTGGADPLMEADFEYNVAEWEPRVDYEVSGGEGNLAVEQGSDSGIDLGADESRNEWEVRLNDNVHTVLDVDTGAGETHLDLDSLDLTRVNLDVGAGTSTVDLTGDYERDVEANIDSGAGEVTVQLPSQVSVRVQADSAAGEVNAGNLQRDGNSYTNEAYGDSEVTLEVRVDMGAGELNLEEV